MESCCQNAFSTRGDICTQIRCGLLECHHASGTAEMQSCHILRHNAGNSSFRSIQHTQLVAGWLAGRRSVRQAHESQNHVK